MGTFRKKPVEVEARRIPVNSYRNRTEMEAIAAWCGGKAHRPAEMDEDRWTSGDPVIDIETLEGSMRAAEGDWIIRGVAGEFYPCKPDIFEATYEDVTHEAEFHRDVTPHSKIWDAYCACGWHQAGMSHGEVYEAHVAHDRESMS